jgi:TRAP-type mannitol/chloroaromatic compound transport system substrate-binding protein
VFLFGSSGFPGGPVPIEYAVWFYEGGGKEIINEVYQDKGFNVQVIGLVSMFPAEMFGHYRDQITSMSDFQGMKYRTVGPWAEILETFGASVVSLPGAEVYEAAQRGVIDAFEYATPSVNWDAGFHEVRDWIGFPGIHSPNMVYQAMINKDVWDKLPGDLQHLLQMNVEAHTFQDYAMESQLDALAIEKYKEYGTQIFYLPDDVQEAIVQRSRELVDRNIAEDPLYAEVWEQQYEFIRAWKQRADLQEPTKSTLYTTVAE